MYNGKDVSELINILEKRDIEIDLLERRLLKKDNKISKLMAQLEMYRGFPRSRLNELIDAEVNQSKTIFIGNKKRLLKSNLNSIHIMR